MRSTNPRICTTLFLNDKNSHSNFPKGYNILKNCTPFFMFKAFSIIITILFLAFGIFLGVLNPGNVKFDLIFQQIDIPLSILLAITFSIGMLLSGIYFTFILLSKQWQLRKANKQNTKLSGEIVQLQKQIADYENSKEIEAKNEIANL
ncbi:LapA family protein [Hydrogenovibrio sp. JE_KL2]|nr:LapA family protein [Hydrogenovibrio sp. JE_KL2]